MIDARPRPSHPGCAAVNANGLTMRFSPHSVPPPPPAREAYRLAHPGLRQRPE